MPLGAIPSRPFAAAFPPQGAVLTAGLPVDVWDGAAGVWRPTVVAGSQRPWSVLVPAGDDAEPVTVDPASLRVSLLLEEPVARHWMVRSRLMLLLALAEQSSVQHRLGPVVAEEFTQLAATRPAWREAFRRGAPDGVVVPPAPLWPRSRELVLPALSGDLCSAAVGLLGPELQGIHLALTDAGWSADRVRRHPLVAGLASLLIQAAAPGAAQPTAILPVWPPGIARLTGSARPAALSTSQS